MNAAQQESFHIVLLKQFILPFFFPSFIDQALTLLEALSGYKSVCDFWSALVQKTFKKITNHVEHRSFY